jgi:hypothetical protein
MPFGKYRNRPLRDIPADYLQWVLHEAEAAKEWLKDAIREELERRSGRHAQAQPQGTNGMALREVVKRWFAGLARDYHPDRIGGDGREMKVLNNAHERLRKLVGM